MELATAIRKKTAAPEGEAGRVSRPAAARPARCKLRPAYLQRKLAMSQPGDAEEREADQVAREVAGHAGPRETEEMIAASPSPAAARIRARPVTVRRDSVPDDEVLAASRLCREPEEEEVQLSRRQLDRDGLDEEEAIAPSTLRREAHAADEVAQPDVVAPDIEARIDALRGTGRPLPAEVREDMEQRFGHDFSRVGIHTDDEADALCRRLHARAFAVGQDLFFAHGEFAPQTPAGRELLAHELTHVVQQGGGARRVARAVEPSPAVEAGSPAEGALRELSVLELPPIKHRHAALYTGTGARRAAGYKRSTSTPQRDVWTQGVQLGESAIVQKLNALDPEFALPENPRAQISFKVGSQTLSTEWNRLRDRLMIPDWDRHGTFLTNRSERFQVDHMVELQVSGDPTGNAGNVIGNLELLKGSENASSGSTIMNRIYEKTLTFLATSDPAFAALSADRKADRRRAWLRQHTIVFEEIRQVVGRAGNDADWWTRAEIEAAEPLSAAQPADPQQLNAQPGTFVLASGPGGVEVARYSYESLSFEPSSEVQRRALAGIRIERFELDATVETDGSGQPIGELVGTWDLPSGFGAGNEPVTISLSQVGQCCGAPSSIPGLETIFTPLSPVTLPTPEIRDGQIYAEGRIDTTLPILRGHPIDIVLAGADLRFEMSYDLGMIDLPIPGTTVDECSVVLFYSTGDGFGAEGNVLFSVTNLGEGSLQLAASLRDGVSATGGFSFDSRLFDEADISVWYRDRSFGGSGTIAITQPDRIAGIRSARIDARFEDGSVVAEGSVQPEMPGVEQADLSVSYAEEAGLVIGGRLMLSENAALRSGSVDVELVRIDDVWRVSATGTARPALPGIDSELTVSYDDGAFLAELRGAYRRGMLAGEVSVGATNRSLDDQGQPTGAATPGNPIIVYGSGEASLQVAPWLRATAGIRFAPDGEVSVAGEIGIPGALEIFPRREINRSLFNIAVQAPIVPGIVAEIGGGLSAQAGIGAGMLEELRLGIEYNPADEAATRVDGEARLRVPADAGLRLSVRAGIGLGITGASATGGLEIGGALGVQGAASASVIVEWTPVSGLALDANLAVHAEPNFTFDVSGYVSVRALGFSVYDERWQLASYSFGSGYRFGISLPVAYREGEPFDVRLEDVQFQIPDIDPSALLRGLVRQIV
jgi:hypothetical protein